MRRESGNKSRYLSMVLETRQAIDCLVSFVENRREEEGFDQVLSDLVESLRAAAGERSVFKPVRPRRSIGYEVISTLTSVAKQPDYSAIREHLRTVLDRQAPHVQRRRSALDAIDFLYTVEGKALQQYQRPASPKHH